MKAKNIFLVAAMRRRKTQNLGPTYPSFTQFQATWRNSSGITWLFLLEDCLLWKHTNVFITNVFRADSTDEREKKEEIQVSYHLGKKKLQRESIHRKQDGSSSSNPQAQKSEAYAEFSQGRPEEGSAFTNQWKLA
jgi:hypothetical protein